MKPRAILKLAVAPVLGVVAALSAYTSMAAEPPVGNGQTNIALGQVVEGYQLAISTTNKVFVMGEPVVLTASLRNVSTNTLPVSLSSSWFNLYYLEVLGPDRTSVPLTDWGKQVGVNTLKGETLRSARDLAPGAQVDTPFFLSDLFQMTNLGDYTVTVTQTPWNRRDGSSSFIRVRSAPLPIGIVPPREPTITPGGATTSTNAGK